MSLKKSIAWIMGIVLLLTVVSGAFLYNQSNRNTGGITSTNEKKYEYIVNDGFAYVKEIYDGARNGEIKKLGSICYEYSKILLNVTPNQTVGQSPSEITDPGGSVYRFILDMPLEITITAIGAQGYNVYLCWQSDAGDPEDPPQRYLAGTGSKITVDEYPEGYGSEDCWLEIESPRGNVTIKRIVVQMVPQVESSGVTSVVATSKNLVDYTTAFKRDGKTPLNVVENGVIMPAGEAFYIVIPISLPSGTYTVSYSGSNEFGETIGKYCFQYSDGTYSTTVFSSQSTTVNGDVKNLFLYKTDPTVALSGDLIISSIQVESGSVATEYTPYFPDKTVLSIPSAVQNLPGYGVGSGSLYNYLDLSRGVYVQTCKLDGSEVVALDQPKEYDVSAFLSPGSGAIDLYGVGSLIFVNYYELDVPSRLSYRCIIN